MHGFVFCGRAWGGQGVLTFEMTFKPAECAVSVLRVALNMLRNDLKMYEIKRTGPECSAEQLEKSTAIQVMLSDLCAVFRCTHHPPRARSTIAKLYGSESANQGQFIQFYAQTGRDICSVYCTANILFSATGHSVEGTSACSGVDSKMVSALSVSASMALPRLRYRMSEIRKMTRETSIAVAPAAI